MPVYVKVGALGGGSWRQIADGNIRAKAYQEGTWRIPTKCYVKHGAMGTGGWHDTGYASYPNPPSAPWVHHWDYSNVQAAWNYAAGGGPPIAYYDVQLLYSDGNFWTSEASTDNISPMWGIGQDARCQIRVRSVGTNGLASAWQGNLRVGTGHPETYNYGWVQRTRGWESEHIGGARNRDDPFWVGFGGNIYASGMHWRNLRTPQSSVVSPGTNRSVAWIVYGNEYGVIHNNYGTIYSGSSIDHPLGNWGDGNPWGIVARGAGWSTTGNGTYMLWCDDFWCSGTEYYNNWEVVSTNPAQGNYYW